MEIVVISLENEMDLVLAHRRSMRVAERLGLTTSTQTTFATAVSEISRSVIEHTDTGILRIGIDQDKQRFSLKALVSYDNSVKLTSQDDGFFYAQKLVPQFIIFEESGVAYVEMKIGLPRSLNLDSLKLRSIKEFFLQDAPLNAYEELKQQNQSLKGIAEEQQQEIRLSKIIDKNKTEFISVASHEIRTPITVLKAYAQIGKKLAGSSDMRLTSLMDKIDVQTTKLVDLVQRLMDVSKLEVGHLDYNWEFVSLDTFILDLVAVMQDIMPSHTLYIIGCAEIDVKCDRLRLEQVFSNLINNASKYSPKGTTIFISAKVLTDGFVTISIQDEGIGMNEITRKSVFEKFYRDENAAKASTGLGIGLYVTSQIVKDHGGEIWLESEEGKGSVFHFSIPLTTKVN
ncbi:sensor histidine kinase [Pedobacter sp. AW1-32]|uniref:sensor histidine kinase n=1 Tax=Pedobacter sp. AW1-32 TaxID=3383026 RepID=UPI003FEF77E4